MDKMVLVTYATRYGSTAEVAQAVAQEINACGIPVRCESIQSVGRLDPYCAVVIGAALYMGRLHKNARRFLTAHEEELAKLPVALLVSGPVNREEKDWVGAEEQLRKELAHFPRLDPVANQIIGGKFDPSTLGFPLNLIPFLRKMKAADVRDWTMIREWARDLAPKLEPVLR